MLGPFGIGYNISGRGFLPAYVISTYAAVFTRSAGELEAQAIAMANQGLIDPVANLKDSKAYVFDGGLDPVYPQCEYMSVLWAHHILFCPFYNGNRLPKKSF